MILRVTVGVVLLCNRIIPSGFLEEHCRTFVVFICRLSFISHMVSWTFSTLPSVLFARTDEHVSFSYNHLIYALSCSTLPMPSYHATRRKHEGWDTARLPKPRQGKSRGRGRFRTTNLLFTDRKLLGSNPTSAYRLLLSRLGQLGSIPVLASLSVGMAVRYRNGATRVAPLTIRVRLLR
ncbi:hypothetical protein CSKR_110668 [Clonorchis sinensis]|uniref:Uncharacterized protein n=1 Tax=Clonorchis sinensis TaxID=79923 RepID=A0A419PXP6_CLOSI|nr:hypothetical protein CSKR_110668 [Clonorchis sinensis]